jgi:predicted nuclease of predicted toxin-antitoxin system
LKLLLDANLSYRMLGDLAVAFPASSHVRLLNLETASDDAIWHYARQHGFAIVTQDSDFHELTTLRGAPPKIVWLKCGNQPRVLVTRRLLENARMIESFSLDPSADTIEIG